MDAKVDPIAKSSRDMIEEVNEKYSQELRMLCREYGDIEVQDAIMFGADRLGFDILGHDETNWHEFRMPLEKEVTDIEEYRDFVSRACHEVRKVAYKKNVMPQDKL